MTKFERMVKSLPNFYRPTVNTFIKGLLQGWAIGDDEIEIQIQNTRDQLFVKTAEGKYLDRLGTNVGVDRAAELGMDDSTFQSLVPVMSFYPKQVRGTIVSLLDVFWGPEFTRPSVTSGNIESFDFGPETTISGTTIFRKDTKIVTGTGTSFTTELSIGDYIKPVGLDGTAYTKVSDIISDTELELTFPWTGAVSINTSVSKGVVRTLEYQVDKDDQRVIRFLPYAFTDITAISAQELVDFINSSEEHNKRTTASVVVDPQLGSLLNIRSNTAGLQGAIQIIGGDANDITRLNFDTDLHIERKVSVFEINSNELIVKIPSSVPILRRTLKGAAHPEQVKSIAISDSEVFDFSGLGVSSTLIIEVEGTPTTITFTHASDFLNTSSVTSKEIVAVINSQITGVQAFTQEPDVFTKVGLRTTAGKTEYQVTGGTANSVLNFTTDLQTDEDLINVDRPSAYIFDPVNQLFTVTGTKTELTTLVGAGSIVSALALSDASSFPNSPGKFIINFGKSIQEGPISYSSRPNNSTLLIDASYTFNNEHPIGSSINFVSNDPITPRVDGSDYAAYVTGTEEARQEAQNLIRKLIAAGVVVRFVIEFPEYLFVCSIIGSGADNINDPDYRGSRTNLPPLEF